MSLLNYPGALSAKINQNWFHTQSANVRLKIRFVEKCESSFQQNAFKKFGNFSQDF